MSKALRQWWQTQIWSNDVALKVSWYTCPDRRQNWYHSFSGASWPSPNLPLEKILLQKSKDYQDVDLAAAACSLLLWGSPENLDIYKSSVLKLESEKEEEIGEKRWIQKQSKSYKRRQTWFQECWSIGGRQRGGRLEEPEWSSGKWHWGGRNYQRWRL